jgi:hypothetical protein
MDIDIRMRLKRNLIPKAICFSMQSQCLQKGPSVADLEPEDFTGDTQLMGLSSISANSIFVSNSFTTEK